MDPGPSPPAQYCPCKYLQERGLLALSMYTHIAHLSTYFESSVHLCAAQCTEVRFASFFSGGFINAIVVNPMERKLAKTPLCTGFKKFEG